MRGREVGVGNWGAPVPHGNDKSETWLFPSNTEHLTWEETFRFQAVLDNVVTGG